jgi:hypothetical protein
MKTIRNLIFGSTVALFCTLAAHAASPQGSWSIDQNGTLGTVTINVAADGTVTGTLFSPTENLKDPIKGFWTDSAQRLVFYRVIRGSPSTPPDNIQVFTGYLFPAQISNPTGSQRLAGYTQSFARGGGTQTRNVFGWYASH